MDEPLKMIEEIKFQNIKIKAVKDMNVHDLTPQLLSGYLTMKFKEFYEKKGENEKQRVRNFKSLYTEMKSLDALGTEQDSNQFPSSRTLQYHASYANVLVSRNATLLAHFSSFPFRECCQYSKALGQALDLFLDLKPVDIIDELVVHFKDDNEGGLELKQELVKQFYEKYGEGANIFDPNLSATSNKENEAQQISV